MPPCSLYLEFPPVLIYLIILQAPVQRSLLCEAFPGFPPVELWSLVPSFILLHQHLAQQAVLVFLYPSPHQL